MIIVIPTNSNNIQKMNDNSDINEIENFLKNKTKPSFGGKNFLGSSINYILINEFKVDELNSKTDIKKNYNKKNKLDNNIIYEDIDTEKEKEETKFDLNLNNILIPMLNNKKENNCFLNVLIQVLFNLDSFRKYIINYFKIRRYSKNKNTNFISK